MDIYTKDAINNKLTKKQDTLVSGTNIKTINGNSLLGSGNVAISGSGDALVRIHITEIYDAAYQDPDSSMVFVGYYDLINSEFGKIGLDLDTLALNWGTLMTGTKATTIWSILVDCLKVGYCFSCFYTVNGGRVVSPTIGNNYLAYIWFSDTTSMGRIVFKDETTLKAAFASSTMTLDD